MLSSTESESSKEYVYTKPENLTVLNNMEDDRTIKPIPFTGESEEFSVKITDKEVAGLKDNNGDIYFSKGMEFCLPRFDRDVLGNSAFGPERPQLSLWEWQAARMSNCMSNFHTPKLVDKGIKRRRRVNGVREREPVAVAVPCSQ